MTQKVRKFKLNEVAPQPKPAQLSKSAVVTGSTPLRPEMASILTTLANEVVGWRTNVANAQQRLAQADAAFSSYVTQCAELLHLDPATVMFDASTSVFVPKPPTSIAEAPSNGPGSADLKV